MASSDQCIRRARLSRHSMISRNYPPTYPGYIPLKYVRRIEIYSPIMAKFFFYLSRSAMSIVVAAIFFVVVGASPDEFLASLIRSRSWAELNWAAITDVFLLVGLALLPFGVYASVYKAIRFELTGSGGTYLKKVLGDATAWENHFIVRNISGVDFDGCLLCKIVHAELGGEDFWDPPYNLLTENQWRQKRSGRFSLSRGEPKKIILFTSIVSGNVPDPTNGALVIHTESGTMSVDRDKLQKDRLYLEFQMIGCGKPVTTFGVVYVDPDGRPRLSFGDKALMLAWKSIPV